MKKIKTYSRQRQENYIDSLSKEDQRELAIRYDDVKTWGIVGWFFCILFVIVLVGASFELYKVKDAFATNNYKNEFVALGIEICEDIFHEEFYTTFKTNGRVIVECQDTKIITKVIKE